FKEKEWWETVGPAVRQFGIYIGRSVRQGGALVYDTNEDILKDVVGKKGVAFLQDLAAYYNPRVGPDARFSQSDMADIIATFDTLFGSELTLGTRAKRWIANIWASRGTLPKWPKIFAYMAFSAFMVTMMAMIVLFVMNFLAVIVGAFANTHEPLDFMWMTFPDGRMGAVALTAVGGAVMTIMLFLLRPAQAVLNLLVAWMPGPRSNPLTSFGYRFTFILMPAFAIAFGILYYDSPVQIRIALLLLAFMGLGTGMGFKVAETEEEARLLTYRSAKYAAVGMLGILTIEWIIRSLMYGGWEWLWTKLLSDGVKQFVMGQWFFATLIAAIVIAILFFIAGLVASIFTKYGWPVIIAFALLFMGATGFSFYAMAHPPKAETPTAVTTTPAPAPA
ncbi:MAG: hypothetical protein AAB403_02195, partial [Planctomycetota bacterium]